MKREMATVCLGTACCCETRLAAQWTKYDTRPNVIQNVLKRSNQLLMLSLCCLQLTVPKVEAQKEKWAVRCAAQKNTISSKIFRRIVRFPRRNSGFRVSKVSIFRDIFIKNMLSNFIWQNGQGTQQTKLTKEHTIVCVLPCDTKIKRREKCEPCSSCFQRDRCKNGFWVILFVH